MNILKLTTGFALFIFLLGCTHSISMDPTIGPTARIPNPVDLRIGLYIPADVSNYVISDRQDGDKYVFEIGESLESIITASSNRVFAGVVILESQPTSEMIGERDLDLVMIPRVTSAGVSLNKEEGALQDDARGSTTISVELTIFDSEMILFTTVLASGIGIASETMGFFSDLNIFGSKKEYAASVEDALIKLSDDMVRQLYGNYDIRQKGDKSD